MLIFEAYAKTWPMCLASVVFLLLVAALAYKVKATRLERDLSAKTVFWICLALWLVLLAVCLTLIDKPHFDLSSHTKGWLFMFSAFLGIPLTAPLLACAAWALAGHFRGETVNSTVLALLALGAFGLGCAASNMHDVVWCGAITDWYAHHHKAGYDLDLFVAFGRCFGIPRDVLSDYATLGPYTILLVLGELTISLASFVRLGRIHAASE